MLFLNITSHLSYLYLAVILTGLLTGSILVLFRKPDFHRYNYYLGISFLSLSLALTIPFLYLTDLIYQVVHMYRLSNVFVFVSFPFSYFYLRSIVKGKGIQYTDLLFFIPLVIYAIDFMPFFLQSADEKLKIIQLHKNNTTQTLAYGEGWLAPPWFHLYLRELFILFIWLMQLRVLLDIRTSDAFRLENKNWYNWIRFYQFHQTFYWLPTLIVLLFSAPVHVRIYTEVIPIIFLVLIHLYLFFSPSILYGVKGLLPFSEKSDQQEQPKDYNTYLPEDRVTEILHKLPQQIHHSKAFLAQGYALHNLASDLGEPPRVVSGILNKKLNTNFNEYINRLRVEHSIELIEMGAYKTKTIEALAYECGFSNRTSFINAFKKFKNVTPSRFIKNYTKDF